ncbi:MAG TPA: type II toxin-antitoxin system RelB/DinJ family antitoxin [Candidatus Kapabacteria bacterium]
MSRTAMIRARVEPKLKTDVEAVFSRLGLSSSEAINMFYAQVSLRRGLPFDVVIPNKTTLRTLKKTEEGKEIVRTRSKKEFFEKLGL